MGMSKSMNRVNKVDSFNEQAANSLSARLKKKVAELQESIGVIDELAKAKSLYKEINSTNKALDKQIGMRKEELAGFKEEVQKAKDVLVAVEIKVKAEIASAKADCLEVIKTATGEAKKRVQNARTGAEEAENDSVKRIRIAGKKADEAENLAAEAVSRAEAAQAKYENLKVTLFS